jgi:hypothetical protein
MQKDLATSFDVMPILRVGIGNGCNRLKGRVKTIVKGVICGTDHVERD